MEARGVPSFKGDWQSFVHRYKGLAESHAPDTVAALMQQIEGNCTQDPDKCGASVGLRQYAAQLFNWETASFLHDTDRYRSDFEEAFDVPSWMVAYQWDLGFDGPRSYPVGGMSEFCRRMVDRMLGTGRARVFLSEPVVKADLDGEARYRLVTASRRIVTSERLVLALPAVDYDSLSGGLIDDLRATSYFDAVLSDEVAIVGHTWAKRWWDESRTGFCTGQAVTTSTLNLYSHIFTNFTAYEWPLMAARSVFCDGKTEVAYWKSAAALGIHQVEQEAIKGLQEVYPDVGTIPKPDQTLFKLHRAGWSWLKAGSYAKGITAETCAKFAAEPSKVLRRRIPPCTLALPTDSWGVRNSGWGAAGVGIAVDWLNQCFGFNISNRYDICNPHQGWPTYQTWDDCHASSLLADHAPKELKSHRQHNAHLAPRRKRRHRHRH